MGDISLRIDEIEVRLCSLCNEWKGISDYYGQKKHSKSKGNYIYYPPYCKDCTKTKAMNWEKEHPEKLKENRRKTDSNRTEKKKEYTTKRRENGKFLEWQRNNPEKLREYANQRKQHKDHRISKDEWISCKEYFNNECAYCGLHISEHFNRYAGELKWTDFHKEHVDHDGSNTIDNCVPSCKLCNSEKHIYGFADWYTEGRRGYTFERKNKILKWLNDDYTIS